MFSFLNFHENPEYFWCSSQISTWWYPCLISNLTKKSLLCTNCSMIFHATIYPQLLTESGFIMHDGAVTFLIRPVFHSSVTALSTNSFCFRDVVFEYCRRWRESYTHFWLYLKQWDLPKYLPTNLQFFNLPFTLAEPECWDTGPAFWLGLKIIIYNIASEALHPGVVGCTIRWAMSCLLVFSAVRLIGTLWIVPLRAVRWRLFRRNNYVWRSSSRRRSFGVCSFSRTSNF